MKGSRGGYYIIQIILASLNCWFSEFDPYCGLYI